MGFMQKVKAVLDDEYNMSVTENGAVGYRTSGKALLDLNFAVSSFRNMEPEGIIEKFVKAYYENPTLALRWLFFAGDIRQGLGERRLFKTLLFYLAKSHTAVAEALMPLIPEYSRWDVIMEFADTPLEGAAWRMAGKQLKEDLKGMEEGKAVSLLAKWLPSENASSERKKALAITLAGRLSMTRKQYRQALSALRSYLDVAEVKMSSKRWSEINYEAVPSRANLLYNKAFLRNDGERRQSFLNAVSKGEKKIHGGVLYPHDIVHSYFTREGWRLRLKPEDSALEELWKTLPDFVQGEGNTLCIADGSGSMVSTVGNTNISCLDVANALAIYFSERCKGQFKDTYITFSEKPQFVDLSKGKSLHDKLEIAINHNEVANTNIEAVFELILTAAVKNHMSKEELPSSLLILSDMEFDMATKKNVNGRAVAPDEKLFDVFKERYKRYGYRLPRLVFWNICSRTNTIPIRENALGVALVSGFSPTIVKMVLSKETDPYKILKEQLLAPRYDAVEEAVRALV